MAEKTKTVEVKIWKSNIKDKEFNKYVESDFVYFFLNMKFTDEELKKITANTLWDKCQKEMASWKDTGTGGASLAKLLPPEMRKTAQAGPAKEYLKKYLTNKEKVGVDSVKATFWLMGEWKKKYPNASARFVDKVNLNDPLDEQVILKEQSSNTPIEGPDGKPIPGDVDCIDTFVISLNGK